MTCIAVCKNKSGRIMMAGDRRLTMDWSLAMDMPRPKIKKDDSGMLLGAAGSGQLCTVVIDMLDIPEYQGENIDVYIQFKLRKNLLKSLSIAGYKDEHNILKIPQEDGCSALVVLNHKVFMVDIRNPDELSNHGNMLSGIVEIEEAPLPYAVGCGSSSAIPILLAEKKLKGYNTREGLKLAMEIAADISPGCSNSVDIITEN